jgi:TRAP-type C4-dicarboxylate transport system permease small subunit
MNGFLGKIDALTRYSSYIAAVGLASLMFLTVGDVILRTSKSAIVGTYELVGFLGAIAIGFSFPRTAFERHHVSVDIVTAKLPRAGKMTMDILTRCAGMVFFFVLGWNLIAIGLDYYKSGEVSPTLQVPFYPVACAVGICCFVQCLVLISDIVKILTGKFDEGH